MLGLIGIAIPGGIGSCVKWIHSPPEAPSEGAIDNPEIKQCTKKNMGKR